MVDTLPMTLVGEFKEVLIKGRNIQKYNRLWMYSDGRV